MLFTIIGIGIGYWYH